MQSKNNSYLAIAVTDKDSHELRFSVIIEIEVNEDGNLVFSQEGVVYDSSSEDRPKTYNVSADYFTPTSNGLIVEDVKVNKETGTEMTKEYLKKMYGQELENLQNLE